VLHCRNDLERLDHPVSPTQRGDVMKRFRLSTLMLLIVIAALALSLVTREVRTARRRAEMQARVAELQARLSKSVNSEPVVSEVRRTQVKPIQRQPEPLPKRNLAEAAPPTR
jgi:hypothetical protein